MRVAVPVPHPAPFPHHFIPAGMAVVCAVLALMLQGACGAVACRQAPWVARGLVVLAIGFAAIACFVYVQYRRALIHRATHLKLMPPRPPP